MNYDAREGREGSQIPLAASDPRVTASDPRVTASDPRVTASINAESNPSFLGI